MAGKRRAQIWALLMAAMIFMAFLQGCLSKSGDKDSLGTISGTLASAGNSQLMAVSGDTKVLIPVDENGHFAARLAPGIYQLLLQSSDGQLTLIRQAVAIENNMTVTVVDADLVPMPQVTSVAVPLVYSTSAVVEWETSIESDGYIDYGTNELYGYSSYAATDLKTRHRVQLYNLSPATTYHFRIVASRYNLETSRTFSRDFAFTTEP
ncbi:MAG: fibronectin type III domain-containing protein [Candidatus Riflebacteria bacterium]|nr:fibronectin type III domain-containing protein [Candidatus Riflebacteria bacterium]